MSELGHYGLVNVDEYMNEDAKKTFLDVLSRHTSCEKYPYQTLLAGYDTVNLQKARSFYQLHEEKGKENGWSKYDLHEMTRCGYISYQGYYQITGELYSDFDGRPE